MRTMINFVLITSAVLGLNGCAALDQPRSQERQARSDECWGYGTANTGVYLATLAFKPFVCPINDLARGQPQLGSGGVAGQHIITPSGTYSIITSPGLTTVHQVAK